MFHQWTIRHVGYTRTRILSRQLVAEKEFHAYDDLDEAERIVCKKWASIANISLPCKGEKFVAKSNLPLFLTDQFRTPVAVLPTRTTSGPITGYGYYQDFNADAWDPPSGLWVEFEQEHNGATRTVFMQITRNHEVNVESHTAAMNKGVWGEDAGPTELLCLEDATAADLIRILQTAGIDNEPDEPPPGPPADTDDEASVKGESEATRVKVEKEEDDVVKREFSDASIESVEGPISIPDEDPDEAINEEYFDMLYDAHVRLTRTMLKTPHWNKALVPYVPDAARSFFETFRDKTFEQRRMSSWLCEAQIESTSSILNPIKGNLSP